MLNQNLTSVILIVFPPLMVIIGSFIGLIRSPVQRSISIIQHFTAGLALAAVAKELLFEAHKKKDTKLGTIMFFIGFFIIFLLEAL